MLGIYFLKGIIKNVYRLVIQLMSIIYCCGYFIVTVGQVEDKKYTLKDKSQPITVTQ